MEQSHKHAFVLLQQRPTPFRLAELKQLQTRPSEFLSTLSAPLLGSGGCVIDFGDHFVVVKGVVVLS